MESTTTHTTDDRPIIRIPDTEMADPETLTPDQIARKAEADGMTMEEYCEYLADLQTSRDGIQGVLEESGEVEDEAIDITLDFLRLNHYALEDNIESIISEAEGGFSIALDWNTIRQKNDGKMAYNLIQLMTWMKENYPNVNLSITIEATAKERFVDLPKLGMNEAFVAGVKWKRQTNKSF